MLRNRNKPWTTEDIEILDYMIRKHFTVNDIASALGRTHRAIECAIKNSIYQQLIHKDADSVADHYDTDVDYITDGIVHPKYYVDSSTIESDNEHIIEPCIKGFLTGFAIILLGGTFCYLHALQQNWQLITYNTM